MDKWAMAEQVMEKVAAERVQQMEPQLIAEIFCKMAEEGQLGPSTHQRIMTALLGAPGAGISAEKGKGWDTFGKTYVGGATGGLKGMGLGALGGGALGAGIGALARKKMGLPAGHAAGVGALLGAGGLGSLGSIAGQVHGQQKALGEMYEDPEQLTE